MKVKAIQKGYYFHRRRAVGEVFEVKEKEFSEKWMVKVKASRFEDPIEAVAEVVYDEDEDVI